VVPRFGEVGLTVSRATRQGSLPRTFDDGDEPSFSPPEEQITKRQLSGTGGPERR
jgi:hypothetical protein